MFDIYLTDEIVAESDGYAVYGRVHIGEYSETFVASLVNWSASRYESQWLEGCRRLLAGHSSSVLITSFVDPCESECVVRWPLYLEGETVHIRNELVRYSQLEDPFSVAEPWATIRQRKPLTEDGLEISEWSISIEAVQEYVNRRDRERSTK